MKKKLLVSTMALAMLVGCSSSGGAGSTAGTSTASGNSVTIATDTDILSMNSSTATDGTSFVALTMCEAGLTQLNEKNVAEPDLAESWDVSDDGLEYTFHIRKDAKWSDGTALTANDFVYAWNRLIDPDTASEYAFLMDKNAESNTTNVKDWEAEDDYTLKVTLSKPCDFFLSLCAFPSLFPLNEAFTEEQGDQYALSLDNMLYCGPYKLTEWTANTSWKFEKNDQYWDADSYSDNVDEANWRLVQGQSAILDYQAGNLDYVKLTSEVIDDYAGKEDVVTSLTGYAWYLSLNFHNEYLANDNIRKAIAYAIDTDELCTSVLKDGSTPLDGIVTKSTTANADGEDFRDISGTVVLGYDEDKAKEYFEAGCKELGVSSISVEFLYEDADVSKNVAAYVMSALEKAGFETEAKCEPKKSRLQDMQNDNYTIALHRWGPDYADPQTYMDLFVTGASNNYGHYESTKYDTLINTALTTDAADSKKRWEDFAEAEKVLVNEEVAIVPLYQSGNTALQNTKLTGIQYHGAGVDNYRHMKLAA